LPSDPTTCIASRNTTRPTPTISARSLSCTHALGSETGSDGSVLGSETGSSDDVGDGSAVGEDVSEGSGEDSGDDDGDDDGSAVLVDPSGEGSTDADNPDPLDIGDDHADDGSSSTQNSATANAQTQRHTTQTPRPSHITPPIA
jgi:hypothetical protein